MPPERVKTAWGAGGRCLKNGLGLCNSVCLGSADTQKLSAISPAAGIAPSRSSRVWPSITVRGQEENPALIFRTCVREDWSGLKAHTYTVCGGHALNSIRRA